MLYASSCKLKQDRNISMVIAIQIPSVLRSYCDETSEFSLAATSVQEALDQIERDHPSLYVNIFDELGSPRQHVNLFINSSLVHHDKELDTTLAPGDVLSIFQAASGG